MEAARTDWHVFASPDEVAEALAKRVARELVGALGMRGKASLAVSGGKTPVRFFQALSAQPLDWRNVGMTLVDERLVPDTNQRSNARLVQENLLRYEAAEARFIPLYSSTESSERAARNAESALAISAFPFPLDVVVLGMGTDGHTASFFPDAGNLESLLDPSAKAIVAPVHAASGGEPRLTLTLARIVEAGFVAIHIEGADKRQVLETATAAKARLPISAVLDHVRQPVQVFWAP
jgi:6-phosphogluconolactonase